MCAHTAPRTCMRVCALRWSERFGRKTPSWRGRAVTTRFRCSRCRTSGHTCCLPRERRSHRGRKRHCTRARRNPANTAGPTHRLLTNSSTATRVGIRAAFRSRTQRSPASCRRHRCRCLRWCLARGNRHRTHKRRRAGTWTARWHRGEPRRRPPRWRHRHSGLDRYRQGHPRCCSV